MIKKMQVLSGTEEAKRENAECDVLKPDHPMKSLARRADQPMDSMRVQVPSVCVRLLAEVLRDDKLGKKGIAEMDMMAFILALGIIPVMAGAWRCRFRN
jgi:hypothetical protein